MVNALSTLLYYSIPLSVYIGVYSHRCCYSVCCINKIGPGNKTTPLSPLTH